MVKKSLTRFSFCLRDFSLFAHALCVCIYVTSNGKQQEWQLKDGRVYFGSKDVSIKMETPALQVVHNTLGYARELDRIV